MSIVSCLTVGHGEHAVICLHGWLGDRRSFSPTVPYLDRERFTYVFVDARGYGSSRAVDGEFTIKEMAEDLVRLADSRGWDKFSLVGHSMGGMAVQRVLVNSRERVRRLVAVSPVPASGAVFDDQAWKLFTGAVGDVQLRQQILEMVTGKLYTPTWIRAMAEESLQFDERALRGYLESHSSDDFHEGISGNSVPTLVLLGDADPTASHDEVLSTWSQWYSDVRLELLPGVTHLPMAEAPVRLVTLIERHLEEA